MKREIFKMSTHELRRRAADFFNKNPEAIRRIPPADIQMLVEELHIHQVELEMQNEELRRVHLELQETRDRYADLYDFAPLGYFTLSEKGIIREANLTGASLLGMERGLLIGQPFSHFIEADNQDIFYLHRQNLFASKARQNCELRLKKVDGGIFAARLESVAATEKKTANRRIKMAIADITDLKQAEKEKALLQAQLQQAQKMEAIGTLAGGIAHDFNNLLQAVLGYTEILLFDKMTSDPGYHELHAIRRAAERGGNLTRQLLTFSRKVESKLRPVDLNLEVQKIIKLLERTLPKMIVIELRLSPGLDVVYADTTQIEQILLNLAANAKYAMQDEGTLTIQTENIQLDPEFCRTRPEAKPGKYVLLTVSDNGRGIDTKIMDYIYDPFFTTKGLAEGTGLGLTMVYGVVKGHGGHIECVSEHDAGTDFKIYLPAANQAVVTETAVEENLPAGGTETILLVDDEALVRDIGRKSLTRFGYTLLTVEDGMHAVDLYRQEHHRIDLVLLDLIMPKMSGRRCLEALLEVNPRAKIVIASGYSETGPVKEALGAGAKGFISKPYDVKNLLKVVRQVLDAD